MGRFDQFSDNYEEKVGDAAKIFGEGHDYFTAQKVKILNTFLKERINDVQTQLNILEVGCGTGGIQGHVELLDYPRNSVAFDYSFESVKTANTKNQSVCYLNADARYIPVKSDSIDVACLAVVVHHIPPEARAAAFSEVYRVLKPGGVAAVFEHNPFNPLTQYVVKTCDLDDDAVLISRGRLRKLLHNAGFQTPRSAYTTFFPSSLKFLRPVEAHLGWLPLGGQYFIMGEKK